MNLCVSHCAPYAGFSDIKTAEQISLLKYSKTSCGVDFLLCTADSEEKCGWFDIEKCYKTDFLNSIFPGKQQNICFCRAEKSNYTMAWYLLFLLISSRNGM